VLYLERGGRSLLSLPVPDDRERLERLERAIAALPSLVAPGGPLRELRIERVNREPVAASELASALTAVGFRASYRGFLLRGS
jgi:hypothetical protein